MDSFGSRVRAFRDSQGLTASQLAEKLGCSKHTIRNVENGQSGFSQEILTTLAGIGLNLNWLLTGSGPGPGEHFHDSKGRDISGARDFVLVPLVPQKVSAGHGQELLLVAESPPEYNIPRIPAPRKLVNGDPVQAVEVRGDSMTGVQIFDGHMVFYCPGEVRGDGLYILQVDGEALVKRLEFNPFDRKIVIHSENPRYSTRTESQDSQSFIILGKVRGWFHSHPY